MVVTVSDNVEAWDSNPPKAVKKVFKNSLLPYEEHPAWDSALGLERLPPVVVSLQHFLCHGLVGANVGLVGSERGCAPEFCTRVVPNLHVDASVKVVIWDNM